MDKQLKRPEDNIALEFKSNIKCRLTAIPKILVIKMQVLPGER